MAAILICFVPALWYLCKVPYLQKNIPFSLQQSLWVIVPHFNPKGRLPRLINFNSDFSFQTDMQYFIDVSCCHFIFVCEGVKCYSAFKALLYLYLAFSSLTSFSVTYVYVINNCLLKINKIEKSSMRLFPDQEV